MVKFVISNLNPVIVGQFQVVMDASIMKSLARL